MSESTEPLKLIRRKPAPMTRAQFRAASVALTRLNWMRSANLTFRGRRDMYEALGYSDTITPQMYRERYSRNAVAARIVEAKPQSTWRGGGEVIETEDPQQFTPFEQAWAQLELRLNIWPTFHRADVLAGLGRYGVILLGAPGMLLQPIRRLTTANLKYLSPFSEEDAEVLEIDEDRQSERFGQPVYYNLKRMAPAPSSFTNRSSYSRGGVTSPTKVHWTRILHIADGALDDLVYAPPRLERVWNLCDDLEKVTGGGAEAFWKRADQGRQWDLDPTVQLDPEGEELLVEEMEEYKHGMRRDIRTRGMKISSLGSDVASFAQPVDAIIAQMAAGTGIPQRILMGSERGHLASTQDRDNWAEQIHDRRMQFAGPQVVRAFVDRLIYFGTLPAPKEYFVRWPLMKVLDDVEKANMAETMAAANQKNGDPIVLVDEIRDRVYGMVPIKKESLVEQKKMNQEANPQPVVNPAAPPPRGGKPTEGATV